MKIKSRIHPFSRAIPKLMSFQIVSFLLPTGYLIVCVACSVAGTMHFDELFHTAIMTEIILHRAFATRN